MTHTHDHAPSHCHGHHHHGDGESRLSFEEKLVKRLEHWIAHNEDHARTYREWAELTSQQGMSALAALLEEVAQATSDINGTLQKAVAEVPRA